MEPGKGQGAAGYAAGEQEEESGMIDTTDGQRMDLAACRHGSPLDAQSMEPEMPKDSPADYCLDGTAQFRAQGWVSGQVSKLLEF